MTRVRLATDRGFTPGWVVLVALAAAVALMAALATLYP